MHKDLRHHLAAEVIACAMDGEGDPTTARGAALSAFVHAFLANEHYSHGRTVHGDSAGSPEQYRAIVDKALELGASDRWDGWMFPWNEYAERLIRYTESIYTYRVPASR